MILCLSQGICDLPHLRLHAGACHDRSSAAIYDRASHVNHVLPVAQGDVLRPLLQGKNAFRLENRHRLPGQGGFLHLHAGALQKPAVCRHRISRLQDDDIAAHKVLAPNRLLLTVPHHPGSSRRDLLQGGYGFLSLALLRHPQHRIDKNDNHDNDHIRKRLPRIDRRHSRDHRCRNQNHDHRISQLTQKAPPERNRLRPLQFILSICHKSSGRFLCTQACPFRIQFFQNFL